jgi:hypothetical protein
MQVEKQRKKKASPTRDPFFLLLVATNKCIACRRCRIVSSHTWCQQTLNMAAIVQRRTEETFRPTTVLNNDERHAAPSSTTPYGGWPRMNRFSPSRYDSHSAVLEESFESVPLVHSQFEILCSILSFYFAFEKSSSNGVGVVPWRCSVCSPVEKQQSDQQQKKHHQPSGPYQQTFEEFNGETISLFEHCHLRKMTISETKHWTPNVHRARRLSFKAPPTSKNFRR